MKFIKKISVPLILFFVSLIIIFPYGQKGFIIGVGESAVPINPSYLKSFYTWNDRVNMGLPFSSQAMIFLFEIFWKIFEVFSFIAHPSVIFIFLSFFLPSLTFYFLLKYLVKSDNEFIYLPPSLLYSLNLFRIQVTYLGEPVSLLFIFMPIFFLFYYRLLNEKKWKYVFALIFISIISSTLGNNFAIFFIPYILCFLYLIFYLVIQKGNDFFKILIFNMVFILSAIIGNLFWIIPQMKLLLKSFSESGGASNIFAVTGSGTFFDHLRFLGFWAWRTGYGAGLYFPFSVNYDKPFLLITGYLVTLLTFVFTLFKDKGDKQKIKAFILFLTTVSLFLLAGTKGNFGFIYQFIYDFIPYLRIYREPFAKFMPLFVFSLSLGLAFSLLYLFILFKKNLFKVIFSLLLSSIILINVYPLFTKESIEIKKWNLYQSGDIIKIPDYWRELDAYFSKLKLDQQITLFPYNYYFTSFNLEYGSTVVGNLADYLLTKNKFIRGWEGGLALTGNSGKIIRNVFNTKYSNFNSKIYLGTLGSKYILQQNEIDWRYDEKIKPPSKSNQDLIDKGFKKIIDFGKFTPEYLAKIPNEEKNKSLHDDFYRELEEKPIETIYAIEDKYFLPHFYTPQNVVISNNPIENLPEIVSRPDYLLRSATFYKENIDDGSDFKNFSNEFLFYGKNKTAIQPVELNSNLVTEGNQYAKEKMHWRPGTFMYKLIYSFEEFNKKKNKTNQDKYLNTLFSYSSKRIAELEKFAYLELSLTYQEEILTHYKQNIDEIIRILEEIEDKDSELHLSLLAKTKETVRWHQIRISQIDLLTDARNDFQTLFKDINLRLSNLEPKKDFFKVVYNFNIPVSGEYDVFIRNTDEISNNENSSGSSAVTILGKSDNQLSAEKNVTEKDIWDWNMYKKIYFNKGERQLVFERSYVSENLLSGNLKIENYSPSTIYKVSFNYNSENNESFSVYEGKQGVLFYRTLFPTKGDYLNNTFYFVSSSKASTATVFVSAEKIKNLQIQKVFQPEIKLRLINKEVIEKKLPVTEFKKINPTKYRVILHGAKGIFPLVFSDSFDAGWKVYLSRHKNQKSLDKLILKDNYKIFDGNEKDQASVFELEDFIKKEWISSLGNLKDKTFKAKYGDYKDRTTGRVDTYNYKINFISKNFNDTIQNDNLRNGSIFETWFCFFNQTCKLSEDTHYLVNGYANAWTINVNKICEGKNFRLCKKNSDGSFDIEMVIEYFPQRIFIIFFTISCLILLISGTFFIIIKNK